MVSPNVVTALAVRSESNEPLKSLLRSCASIVDTNSPVIKMISDQSQFPNIPKALVRHIEHLVKLGEDARILRELAQEPERTARAIDTMFARATPATGLTPDELLNAADFRWKEKDPSRIEAAFAEIRTIYFLHQQGFQNIVPLRAGRTQEADIRAEHNGELYAIEVADSIFHAAKRAQSEQIAEWMMDRLKGGKNTQLQKTGQRIGASRQALVAVLDTEAGIAMNTHDDYVKIAEHVWRALGCLSGLHICLVTGRQALGYAPDDSVFPPWP